MKTRKEEVAELVKRHKEHQETKAISKLFMSDYSDFDTTPKTKEFMSDYSDNETKNLYDLVSQYLKGYLGDILDSKGLNSDYAVAQMSGVYGKDILYDIDGFIAFALKHKDDISQEDIQITLAHDLGGALRFDELMLPRVSGFKKHSLLFEKSKKK
tara:strand:- start:2034 stop:2501 length:468 start_codon:yes stop_codon:yes gene_type:complete